MPTVHPCRHAEVIRVFEFITFAAILMWSMLPPNAGAFTDDETITGPTGGERKGARCSRVLADIPEICAGNKRKETFCGDEDLSCYFQTVIPTIEYDYTRSIQL